MSLRDQMRIDADAILSTEELGESALVYFADGSQACLITVRFIAQPERQTIKRAFIWTKPRDVTLVTNDLIAVNRTKVEYETADVDMLYRVMYSDMAETGIQRNICHEQLEGEFRVMDRQQYKTIRGADGFRLEDQGTAFRGKFVLSDATHVSRNNQRRMRSDWQLFVEQLPTLKTDQVIVDSDGRGYRIEDVENPLDRIDLPYLTVSRIDG